MLNVVRAALTSILLPFLMPISAKADLGEHHEKPIVVIIPSYKNSQWYQKNLDSVFSQNYRNFRVIYIDDASPDGTGELVRSYTEEKGQEFRVTLIKNEKRVGALANLYRAIWMCAPHEIVANLDGDDWFHHDNALARINQAYADPDVWMTYGQFMYYPAEQVGFAKEVPPEVIAENSFRKHSRGTTALRTFFAGLFHKIKKEDLFYNGNFFPSAWDLAMMWPILEMAGVHSRFVPDVLYVYNIANPINDFKVNEAFQAELDRVTRRMPRYTPIEKPYD